eukprot:2021073-Pyramimonas_sp.AAC.2
MSPFFCQQLTVPRHYWGNKSVMYVAETCARTRRGHSQTNGNEWGWGDISHDDTISSTARARRTGYALTWYSGGEVDISLGISLSLSRFVSCRCYSNPAAEIRARIRRPAVAVASECNNDRCRTAADSRIVADGS